MRPCGTNVSRESLEKVKLVYETLLVDQSKQKEYVDRKVRDSNFVEGEQVLLEVSPINGDMHFGK